MSPCTFTVVDLKERTQIRQEQEESTRERQESLRGSQEEMRRREEERTREKEKKLARETARKKAAVVIALHALRFDITIASGDNEKTLIVGEEELSSKQIEILFDEKTGRFVIHFENVATHGEEHEIVRNIIKKLKEQGYEADITHSQDRPKLPEIEKEIRDGRERTM